MDELNRRSFTARVGIPRAANGTRATLPQDWVAIRLLAGGIWFRQSPGEGMTFMLGTWSPAVAD
jgi:hypothetical protein